MDVGYYVTRNENAVTLTATVKAAKTIRQTHKVTDSTESPVHYHEREQLTSQQCNNLVQQQ